MVSKTMMYAVAQLQDFFQSGRTAVDNSIMVRGGSRVQFRSGPDVTAGPPATLNLSPAKVPEIS